CKSYSVSINGEPEPVLKNEKGYISLLKSWKSGDQVILNLDMPVELVKADPRVEDKIGKRAVQRGPVVYCLEETDNKDIDFDEVSIKNLATFIPFQGTGKLNGMVLLKAISASGRELSFVPYFAWDNREAGKMKVWLDYETNNQLYSLQ
ncbi:MAG: glycoside hydrolase family 127 protein, partial [Bacteroidales bacterium]